MPNLPLHSIEFDNTKISYFLTRSNRRKSVGFKVTNSQSVQVTAPSQMSEMEIADIVRKKAKWILNTWAYYRDIESDCGPRNFVTGEMLLYLGQEYTLQVNPGPVKISSVTFENGFIVTVAKELSTEDRSAAVREAMIQWYRQQAQMMIPERINFFSDVSGLKPKGLRIKNQKTRWGSCSRLGNININLRIMQAHIRIIDYVVVHELCHLRHPNHSKAFWHSLKDILPDYEEHRSWLRHNGPRLKL